jgi:uncharacterized membrane protein
MSTPNGFGRWLRHLWMGPAHARAAFPPDDYRRIEAAIAEGERRHRAELRFAVEASLDPRRLWRGMRARDRAVEVFAGFRIWDTEENNGVLLYVLLADRAVEVVADRGAMRHVDPLAWDLAARQLADGCCDERRVDGALAAIATLHEALARAYPADGRPNPDELPNRPIMLD